MYNKHINKQYKINEIPGIKMFFCFKLKFKNVKMLEMESEKKL